MTDQRSETTVSWTILVVRTGGFAGLRREWRVSSSDEPEVDWPALIEACPWTTRYPPSRANDRFVWRIEATAPPRTRKATLPESSLTGSWRVLVDQVRTVAAR
jgi:hypothetical protein